MSYKLKIFGFIFIVITCIGMLSLYFFWNPTHYNFFPKCPFYSITGMYCPGCGSQRSIHQLLNGHVFEGIRHNYLILLLGLVLSYQFSLLILNKIFHKNFKNMLHKPMTTKIILVLVIAFWVLRNFNYFPFTELAP